MFDRASHAHLLLTPGEFDALGPDPVQALLQQTKTYAPIIMGPADPAESIDDQELAAHLALAKQASAKLQDNVLADLSQEEEQALAAVVYLAKRPSLRVQGGLVRGIPTSWQPLQHGVEDVEAYLPGVGRLDRVSQGARERQGTGWFVKKDRVITNNHVVAGLCGIDPHAVPGWRKLLGEQIDQVNRHWAANEADRPTWDPAESPQGGPETAAGRVVQADLHPVLDMAILQVEGVEDSDSLVIPISAEGPVDPSDRVYVLGYPAVASMEHRLHRALLRYLFGDKPWGMDKRVAPGALRNVGMSPVSHDATTLGGSSGSAVMDLESHLAVGLHYWGSYWTANDAVPLWMYADDPLFQRHGIEHA